MTRTPPLGSSPVACSRRDGRRVGRLLALCGCIWIAGACRLGAPEPALANMVPGSIEAPVAEPGLQDALADALATSLGRHGALVGAGRGGRTRSAGDPVAVWVEVVHSGSEPVAVDAGGAQVYRARLTARFGIAAGGAAGDGTTAGGERARSVVLSDTESYTVLATVSGVSATLVEGDPVTLGASDARAQALARIASRLAEDAVVWFLFAPTESP